MSEKPSAVMAGLAGKCPRCGRGELFSNLLNLRNSCANCDLSYKFIDTGDGPAVFAIFILGFFVLGGALWVEFNFEPEFWVHVVLWGLVTPVLALALLRVLKGLLSALQYCNKAEEGRLDN